LIILPHLPSQNLHPTSFPVCSFEAAGIRAK
jgi:hypothetical protein